MNDPSGTVLVVMGVSGAGKFTLGAALAARLGWAFLEGDTLHSPANIARMRAGLPLSDHDRAPWLARIRSWIEERIRASEPGVITCSALKRAYRDTLSAGLDPVVFVAIEANPAALADRLRDRPGHFMPASLLASQLGDYERPGEDERAIFVSADLSVHDQVSCLMGTLAPEPGDREERP